MLDPSGQFAADRQSITASKFMPHTDRVNDASRSSACSSASCARISRSDCENAEDEAPARTERSADNKTASAVLSGYIRYASTLSHYR